MRDRNDQLFYHTDQLELLLIATFQRKSIFAFEGCLLNLTSLSNLFELTNKKINKLNFVVFLEHYVVKLPLRRIN